MKIRRAAALLVLALALLILTPSGAMAMTYDQAIDKLITDGYAQKHVQWLASQGTSPIGFALGGSTAQTAKAKYLAAELRKLGFVGVRLEPVPLDVYEFKGASVTYGDTEVVASITPGVKATPDEGITAPVVYVGDGTLAEITAAGELDGKIALIDARLSGSWMNWPWTEASLAGAVGIIYCGVEDPGGKWQEPDALGSYDPTYNSDLATAVIISRTSGDALKAALESSPDPVVATIVNDVDVTLMRDGGVGYNVVGTMPGTDPEAGRIVLDAHADSYFFAGMDDTGGCVATLTMAKALRMSGYRPTRSITALFTTGEEFAHSDAYYDWLGGSWYAATHAHREWVGRTAAVFSVENMAQTNAKLTTRANVELYALINGVAEKNPDLLPYGYTVSRYDCWNDQWPWTAAGVPSIYFRARTGQYGESWNHTDYDTPALQDYDYMGKLGKLIGRMLKRLDRGVLPYDIKARADELADAVDGDALESAGAAAAKVDALELAIERFRARAGGYADRMPGFGPAKRGDVNSRLMRLEKRINRAFTALSAWDDTIYPHEQVLADLQMLNDAAIALSADPADPAAAKDALTNIGITWSGLNYSYENYLMNLAMHRPGWAGGLYWGEQGKLAPYLDVMPILQKVDAGRHAAATASIDLMRAQQTVELNSRLDQMTAALALINRDIAAIR